MKLILGDSLQKLRDLPTATVDAVVTDPPAGISFMGRDWDDDKGGREQWVAWLEEILRECLRIMKPGAHAFIWAIPRTSHWTGTAIENAGFEVRDVVNHIYGSGFPKSLDVSKAIDKQNGDARPVIGDNPNNRDRSKHEYNSVGNVGSNAKLTSAASAASATWQGWGTALKPAAEHWILARKPLSEKTVAKNVLKWGTGALNIDGTRIEAADQAVLDAAVKRMTGNAVTDANSKNFLEGQKSIQPISAQGRWPANVLFDEEAALVLNQSVGDNVSRFFKVCGHESIKADDTFAGKKTANKDECLSIAGSGNKPTDQYRLTTISITKTKTHSTMSFQISNAFTRTCIGLCTIVTEKIIKSLTESNIESVSIVSNTEASINLLSGEQVHIKGTVSLALVNDLPTGERKIENITTLTCANTESGPLRFQYQAKASKRERNAGLEGMPEKLMAFSDGANKAIERGEAQYATVTGGGVNRIKSTKNHHPTVKPIRLMEYLCTLITPPGGIILDPFLGSGTTGCAAVKLGFQFIGIERESEYLEIARRRIEHAMKEREQKNTQLDLEA